MNEGGRSVIIGCATLQVKQTSKQAIHHVQRRFILHSGLPARTAMQKHQLRGCSGWEVKQGRSLGRSASILSSGFPLSEFSFRTGPDRTSLDDIFRRETAFAAMFAEVKPLPSHPVRSNGRKPRVRKAGCRQMHWSSRNAYGAELNPVHACPPVLHPIFPRPDSLSGSRPGSERRLLECMVRHIQSAILAPYSPHCIIP